MKNMKWLITLADSKPLLFGLAILLIAVTTLSTVVVNRDRKIDNCQDEKRLIQLKYENKFDSIIKYHRIIEAQLNQKIETTLGEIIADYKKQLEEQKNLNRKVNTAINKNKKLIKDNVNQIKNLQE